MYLCCDTGRSAKFSTERKKLVAKRVPLRSWGKLIGGGDDERELRGFLPEPTQADPSLPPLHLK